jgi:hypothetical protein
MQMRLARVFSRIDPGLLAFLAVGVFAGDADAFCRTSTCQQTKRPDSCGPLPPAGTCETEGAQLTIESGCISYSIQKDGSQKRGITAAKLDTIVAEAFDTWEAADCGNGTHPSVRVDPTVHVTCSAVELNRSGTNQNVWAFIDEGWLSDPSHDSSQLALTNVEFGKDSGRILGVDVELNSDLFEFTLDPSNLSTYNLGSIVQHESGHYLGLAHANFEAVGTTMSSVYSDTLALGALAPDDEAGICTIFPPGIDRSRCNSDPPGGFSTECYVPSDGCCSIGPMRPFSRSRDGFALLLLASGYVVRRRLRSTSGRATCR